MLSKCKGQVLRVAAALHILSHVKVSSSEEGDGGGEAMTKNGKYLMKYQNQQ